MTASGRAPRGTGQIVYDDVLPEAAHILSADNCLFADADAGSSTKVCQTCIDIVGKWFS